MPNKPQIVYKNPVRYLFDSDVLMTSGRLHYQIDFCQSFWDWLEEGHKRGIFFSIDKVKNELLDGSGDPLRKWADSPNLTEFFKPSGSGMSVWPTLTSHAMDPSKNFKEIAKTKFLNNDKADAWLIAFASKHGNYKIVTNEKSEPASKKDIKLPDAASWVGVQTLNLYDILKLHAGHNFSFK